MTSVVEATATAQPSTTTPSSSSSSLRLHLPVELEIEIIKNIPFQHYGTIRRVCKRWYALTLLPEACYVTVTSQIPNHPPPDFKPITFKLHRGIYEVARLWTGEKAHIGIFGFRHANTDILRLLGPYQKHQLTIPPLPHTLQDVRIRICLPPSPMRPVRKGFVSKFIPVPTKHHRKLRLKVNPTNRTKPLLTNLEGGFSFPGITIREFFNSMRDRARMREHDTIDKVEFSWRVRDKDTEFWWDTWDLQNGMYEVLLYRDGIQVEPWLWFQKKQ
ncbi:hypothetical protein ABW20_dc0110684 [Dactylellina cionopaga]|nr:hypothetical protein ABW20_dc0110684 [Dactylellina cionopaga]